MVFRGWKFLDILESWFLLGFVGCWIKGWGWYNGGDSYTAQIRHLGINP